MDWDEEEWEDRPSSGRRARLAAVVLIAVFATAPLFSFVDGVVSGGRLGPLLVAVVVLAVLAGLYALVVRWLRGPKGRTGGDDDLWI